MACSRVARAVSVKLLVFGYMILFSFIDNYQIMGEPTRYIQWRYYVFWSTGRGVTATTRKRNYKPLKKGQLLSSLLFGP